MTVKLLGSSPAGVREDFSLPRNCGSDKRRQTISTRQPCSAKSGFTAPPSPGPANRARHSAPGERHRQAATHRCHLSFSILKESVQGCWTTAKLSAKHTRAVQLASLTAVSAALDALPPKPGLNAGLRPAASALQARRGQLGRRPPFAARSAAYAHRPPESLAYVLPRDFMYLGDFLSPIRDAFFFTASVGRPNEAATSAVGRFGNNFFSSFRSPLVHDPFVMFLLAIS
jgi:hypothetical protein